MMKTGMSLPCLVTENVESNFQSLYSKGPLKLSLLRVLISKLNQSFELRF
jgi:hypothetical protein